MRKFIAAIVLAGTAIVAAWTLPHAMAQGVVSSGNGGYSPTYWYVDNSVGSSGTGTSWATAWKDFSNINWTSVGQHPNSTIYISGGSSSQTYSATTLTVGASGVVGGPITITNGIDASHNGTVIIDGATSMTFGAGGAIVDNNGFTNLVIQGLVLQNSLESCLRIEGVTSGTVSVIGNTCHTGNGRITGVTNATTAANNGILHFAANPTGVAANAAVKEQTVPTSIPSPSYVTSTGAGTVTIAPVNTVLIASGDTIQFAFNARGFRVDGNTGGTVIVEANTVDDPANTIAQTDSFYTQNNTNTVIMQNNIATVNNTDPSGHSDTYQSAGGDSNVTFRGNFLSHPNGGINNHGIIVDAIASGGTVQAYNNIIAMGQTPGNSVDPPEIAVFREQQTVGATGSFKCWNNTIYGGLYGIQLFFPSTSPIGDEYKNNINFSPAQGIVPYFLNGATAAAYAATAFDNNDIFAPNTTNLQVFSTVSTDGLVRSTTSQTTGLLYAEIQLGYIYAGGDSTFGIVNSTESTANWVGKTTNSVGYWWSTGNVYTNAGVVTTIFTSAPGDVIEIAIDEGNHKIWFKNINKNTGWNNDIITNQNPVGNVGGITIAGVTGAHFLAQGFNSATSYSILNVGATSFVGSLPTGYSAWGSSATWDSGHMSANLSLVQPLANNNGTMQTFAAWQTAGYDAHGVNSDPKFTVSAPSFTSPTVYEVLTGSAAINAGTTLATVTTDFLIMRRPQGTSYTIGAFEFPL